MRFGATDGFLGLHMPRRNRARTNDEHKDTLNASDHMGRTTIEMSVWCHLKMGKLITNEQRIEDFRQKNEESRNI